MKRALSILLLMMLTHSLWGQKPLIQESIARANAIKETEGVGLNYAEALFDAADIAAYEGDNKEEIRIYEQLIDIIPDTYPNNPDLLPSLRSLLAILYAEEREYEKALPLLKESYKEIKGKDYIREVGYLEEIIRSNIALKQYNEAVKYRKEKETHKAAQERCGRKSRRICGGIIHRI